MSPLCAALSLPPSSSVHLSLSFGLLNQAPFCVKQLPSHDRSLQGLGVKVEPGVSCTTRNETLQTVPRPPSASALSPSPRAGEDSRASGQGTVTSLRR